MHQDALALHGRGARAVTCRIVCDACQFDMTVPVDDGWPDDAIHALEEHGVDVHAELTLACKICRHYETHALDIEFGVSNVEVTVPVHAAQSFAAHENEHIRTA